MQPGYRWRPGRGPPRSRRARTACAVRATRTDCQSMPIEEVLAKKLSTTRGGTDEARRQGAIAVVDRVPRGTTVDNEVRRLEEPHGVDRWAPVKQGRAHDRQRSQDVGGGDHAQEGVARDQE